MASHDLRALLEAGGGAFTFTPGAIATRRPRLPVDNSPRPKKLFPKPIVPAPPCAFLGERVGEVKVSCGGAMAAKHRCVHHARPAHESRRGTPLPPMGLPTAICQRFDGTLLQPCKLCPLYEPQRLLANNPPSGE
jgi:hypothetical protein